MATITKASAQKAAAQAAAEAQAFLKHQREVLDQAAGAVRAAGRKVAQFTAEEVNPRARDAWQHTRPVLERGVAGTRDVASRAQEKLQRDVLPAVANAVGTAMTVVELAKSEVVRDAIRKAGTTGQAALKAGSKAAVKAGAAAGKRGGGGKVVLVGLGLVVLGTAAYAAWRVFRAEDDLWAPEAEGTTDDD